MVTTRKNSFIKDLKIQTTVTKTELIGSVQGGMKYRNLKNIHFQKKDTKVKNETILHFMTTFLNFALRIQTDGAERVLKPIATCFIRCKQITIT